MRKQNLILLLLLLSSSWIFAQNNQVRGVVLSAETKQPLEGATVLLSKSSRSTTTDQQGRFELTLDGNKGAITVSFVGKESSETEVRAGADITVSLKNSNTTLTEVVAVAYTNVKRSGYPGSVSVIGSDKINNRLTTNITNALQGLAPGIQTTSPNGQPGNSSTIRIRGVGSINASSAPLFVVDGAPYDGDINALNPADIASINILKDAVAANLYGSRAANGVIIITTKQGKKGEDVSVTATYNEGRSDRAVKGYDQLGTNDYFELYWEALRNGQRSPLVTDETAAKYATTNLVDKLGINPYGSKYPQPVGLDGKLVSGATPLWNDDWEKGVQQTAVFRQAQLGFSGATDKATWYTGVGYTDNKGAYIKSGFKRYTFRSNLTLQAKKWLQFGLNLNGAATTTDYPVSSDSKSSNVVLFGRIIPGFYPIYERNEDGSYKLDDKGQKQFDYGSYRPTSARTNANLIGSMPYDLNKRTNENLSARTFLEATLIGNLKYKTSFNIDYINKNTHYYTNPAVGEDAEIGGTVSKDNTRQLSYTWNNILTWSVDFLSAHHLNLLAGQEFYKYDTRNFGGSRQNLALPGFYEPVAASQLNDFTGYSDVYAKLSFFLHCR